MSLANEISFQEVVALTESFLFLTDACIAAITDQKRLSVSKIF